MKIFVRFLRQGCVPFEIDPEFMNLDDDEKMDTCRNLLEQKTDEELLKAMADYTDTSIGYFDDTPMPAAIEHGEGIKLGNIIVQTKEWETFCSQEAFKIVENKKEFSDGK